MKKNEIGIKGRFSTQLIESDGEVSFDSGEQDNLVLDNYLSLDYPLPLGGSHIAIGAGVVTTPAITDTNLGNQIKTAQASFVGVSTTKDAGGVLCKFSDTVDFTGFSGEEVSEIGVRNGSSSGLLITRSLIKDGSGSPTAITVNAGQTLRITYSIYVYFPAVISSGVTSTPHGDLEWSYVLNENYTLGFYTLHSSIGTSDKYGGNPSVGTASLRKARLYYETTSANTPGYITRTVTGSTAELSAYWPATGEDRIIGSTNRTYNPVFITSYYACGYLLMLDAPYTLPANYDFSISWEVTWGRLP